MKKQDCVDLYHRWRTYECASDFVYILLRFGVYRLRGLETFDKRLIRRVKAGKYDK